MKKYIFIVITGFLTSIFLLSGCGKNTLPSIPTSPTTSNTTSSVVTSIIDQPVVVNTNQLTANEQKSWQTFTDKKNGFELRYHPELGITLAPEAGPLSYTVAFSFPQSWYAGTNLHSALLGASVSSSCPHLYSPEEEYVGSLSKTIRNSDNVEFALDHSDEAAAGNYYKTLLYSAVKNNTCYSVFVNLHSTNRMNYDEANRPTEYDPKKFEEVLVKVVSTFKILK